MKNLTELSRIEVKRVKECLKDLMEESIITGFNYYYELAHSSGIIISLSYQHRSKKHLEAIFEDIRADSNLSNLLKSERTNEIKLTREKRAIYLFKKAWPLPKDQQKLLPSVELFNYQTGELLDRSKLNQVEKLEDISEYRDIKDPIALRELDGRELNLNIKTQIEAQKLLDLFRSKGYKMKMTKEGLTYYEKGKPVPTVNSWPDPDRTPCIILGKEIPQFFPKGLPDFQKIHKIALIKGRNEISFCVNKKHPLLIQHSAYTELKNCFGDNLKDISAFANNAFVIEYIDIE